MTYSAKVRRTHHFSRLLVAGVIGAGILPVAVIAQTAPAPAAAPASADEGQDIVVTAQKRVERLSDVPIAIGVVGGAKLETTGATSLSEFAGLVPSLTIANGGTPGQNTIVIRGLATTYQNSVTAPLVSTYVDNDPIGTTVGARAAYFSLDLMPYDLDHVEVLRGPQGTLYGAGAMGGLLKYVLKKPDLERVEGRAGGDLESIRSSSGVGYGVRAMVNLPIVAGKLAARISGYYKKSAGYIDNVGTRIKDANSSQNYGVRAALLWKATDRLDVTASVIAAQVKTADNTDVLFSEATGKPVYGDLKSSTVLQNPFRQRTELYSLNAVWDLDFATLTSSSSMSHLVTRAGLEMSAGFYVPGYPGTPEMYNMVAKGDRFTQEVRLASPDHGRFQWMLGGYFTREKTSEQVAWLAYDQNLQPLPAPYNILELGETVTTGIPLPPHYQEWAAFGNATYKLTDRLDVSGGVRFAQNQAFGCFVGATGLYGNGGLRVCQDRPAEGVVTWMGNLRYRLPGGSMIYTRVATGYRPGGGCTTCGNAAAGIPGIYSDDRLTNYEVGFKGDYFRHRLLIDVTGFYIDWQKIQIQVINSLGFPLVSNAASARSVGVEASGSYELLSGLRLGGNISYIDAVLTSDTPGVDGRKGDPLPVSAKWSGALNLDYRWKLNDVNAVSVGGSYRYKSKTYNQFKSGTHPYPMNAQNVVDLYAGIDLDRYSIRLTLKNAFDNRSYQGLVFNGNPGLPQYVPILPRTIGLSFDAKF